MTTMQGESGATAWLAAQARIQSELGWLHSRWLDGIKVRAIERGQICLEAASPEVKTQAQDQSTVIKAAVAEAYGRPLKLRVQLARAKGRQRKPRPTQPTQELVVLEPERINAGNTLSSFITGAESALPVQFATEAVMHPGRWHPLVFYGESGSGKTHLIEGIVNSTRRRRPSTRTVFTTGNRFARQYTLTMRRRQTEVFRDLFRSPQLLVIDDLQELAGKTGTERELCFTLDHLQLVGAQVVVACNKHPKRIPMDSALRGRLLGGQVVPVPAPGPRTRLEIVKACCASRQLKLGTGVADFLSDGVDLNARELLSALTRLEAHQRLVGAGLELPSVREILADMLEQKVRPASLENLAAFVAEKLGTTVDQLRSRSRKPSIVRKRQFAMALARELTGLTLREVGAFYGGRSCASVHFAQGRAPELQAEDSTLRVLWGDAGRRFQRSGNLAGS